MIERAARHLVAQRVGVEAMLDPDHAADRVQREAEAQVDRGQELDGHDNDEREARLERQEADGLDLDRPEAQVERAAIAAAALAQEAAAADDPRVEAQADPGRRLEADAERVVAVRRGARVDVDVHAGAVDRGLDDAADVHVQRAGDVDRVGDRARQLKPDLAQVQRPELGVRGQHDALGDATGQRQPVGRVDAEDDVRLRRARGPAEQ